MASRINLPHMSIDKAARLKWANDERHAGRAQLYRVAQPHWVTAEGAL